ncbi:M23 family metallopeptidase, partial [Butyricicoccus sp. 1XD8-22]
PELEVNQTRILEIKIEDVSGKEAKIIPSKILTPEDAVQYLQTGTLEKELYTVKAGDVLGSIAMNHDLTTKELLALNPDLTEESVLQIGQEINVTVEKPLVNVQVVLEKLKREKIDYEKIIEQDENMYKGEQVVKQEGSFGKKEVSYLITEVNGQVEEKAVTNEVILEEPVDHIVKVGTKVISSRGTGDFAWPTNGGYISSTMGTRWGEFHRGIDIARPSNYNIKAADNGVVTAAGWDGTYGYRIIINHNNGYETLYAHLSRIDVNIGQVIPKGSVIGIMGSTGNSTGTHLHFEVHKNGAIVNPLAYF